MEIRKVGIVDFARSTIVRAKNGSLNGLTGLEIATQVVRQLLARNPQVPLDRVEHLTCGCAFPEGENGLNVSRQLVIKAGLPIGVAATTVNQFCASSQQALMVVADALAVGKGDIGIVVGLEHMVRVPMGGYNPPTTRSWPRRASSSHGRHRRDPGEGGPHQPRGAGGLLRREPQEGAQGLGRERVRPEVVPIALPDGKRFERDECPMEPNLEKMRSLAPAFDAKGSVTAATSSPVSVGAGAAILMAEDVAEKLELPLRARVVTTAVSGCDYQRMGMGPIPATEKALARAGLKMGDLDVVELNEAFAAQSLYVLEKGRFPKEKTNLLGGAIALGHPLGMSGIRIVGTAITALEKVRGRYGLATMCVGGGQGATTVLERVGR
jgi:acetyl-CoA acyltransferase